MAADALCDYSTGQTSIKYEIYKPNPVLTKILDDIIIDGIFEKKAGSDVGKLLELYYTDFDLKCLLPESREISAYFQFVFQFQTKSFSKLKFPEFSGKLKPIIVAFSNIQKPIIFTLICIW